MEFGKKIDKYNIIETLTLVAKNNKLQSLHLKSKAILKLSSSIRRKYKNKPINQERNQIRINGRFYTLNKKLMNILMVGLQDQSNNYFKRKKNFLKKSIVIIQDYILKDKPIRPYYLKENKENENNDLKENKENENNDLEENKENENNDLENDGSNKLENNGKVIRKDKSKFVKFYKEFFLLEKATYFLHDVFRYIISKEISLQKSHDIEFKVTRLSIIISESIITFIIKQIPTLKNIFKCFDFKENQKLSQRDKIILKDLTNLIFTFNNKQENKRIFFKKYDIKNHVINDYLLNYLADVFLKEFNKNTIYSQEVYYIIQTALKNNYDELKTAEIYKQFVSLGYYLIDLLVETKAFMEIKQPVKGTEHKKSNRKIIIIKPVKDLISDILLKKSFQKAYLTDPQLFVQKKQKEDKDDWESIIEKNINKLIHDSPRINLSLNENCYLHKVKLRTYFSINVNELSKFLYLLGTNRLNDTYLCSLCNVDFNVITELRKNIYLAEFVEDIMKVLRDFNGVISSHRLKKQCTQFFKMLQKDLVKERAVNKKGELIYKEIAEKNQPILEDIINKMCQAKMQLIGLLNDSISYSIFKYFIFTTFIDTRGRAYLSSVTLNIFNNPLAKIFVSLYDPNAGELPTKEDLTNITKCFTFMQPLTELKEAVEMSAKHLMQKNLENIMQYILTYLNITREEFYDILSDEGYFNNQRELLDFLMTRIKKPKKLFYVHSLIHYEQLRYRGKHDKNIFNYFQKDASSSGLQMLSILFRDPTLAEIANLKGKHNYDIYTKAANNCLDAYKKIKKFAEYHTQNLDLDLVLEDSLNNDVKELQTQHNFDASNINNYKFHIISLILYLKIENSLEITSNYLVIVIQYFINYNKNFGEPLNYNKGDFIKPYLPSSIIKLIDQLIVMDKFKNHKTILEYIFCLRYSIRLVYIVENSLNITQDLDSIWFKRELTKKHVMTTLYMSTSYGRKESYLKFLQEHLTLSANNKFINEFASFLEKSTSIYLKTVANLNRIYEFAHEICKDERVFIENKNFTITLQPRITTDFQVSCSSLRKKRGPQLTIKKVSRQIDPAKLKSMFMANLAHSMDSDLMHHFTIICLDINNTLFECNSNYRFVFERNHDCFILNYPVLLTIILIEAYLRLAQQDNISNIKGLSQEIKTKYTNSISCEDFLLHLEPINPNFIK